MIQVLALIEYLYLIGTWFNVTPFFLNDICLKEIGQRAQDTITILGSIINIVTWETLYDHLMSTRIFTLILIKIFMWAPKTMRKVAIASVWI